MKRVILEQLRAWKASHRRKPLLLMGARQVGKTTSLRYFGANYYQNVAYINFEDMPQLQQLFASSLEPTLIVKALEIELEMAIAPETTLLIFDEVQECPNALNSLKYFNEKANQYHICAAGSLLGVKLGHSQGFPVGKVNFLHMYPLSYSEFLEAITGPQLAGYMRSITTIEPLLTNLHEKLLHYFKLYLYIGGMPEAVAEYISSEDLGKVRTVQQEILQAYTLDFAKHAPTDQLMKINQIWGNIPTQLAKENKKFIYSVLRKGARAKDFEVALQWLQEAGLVHKVYNLSTPKLPLDAYANFDFFKLYLLDVGLLAAMVDLPARVILQGNQLFQEFRGSFSENYVAQELAHSQKSLYYWTSEGKAELDFVFQHEGTVYPLEVKAGSSTRKKSLRIYAEKYHPEFLLRGSLLNLKRDGNLLNCPLYLLGELWKLLQNLFDMNTQY